jgi:lysozyme
MKRLRIFLALAALGARLASAQDLPDAPGLADGLGAIKARTAALRADEGPSADTSAAGAHRLGHTAAPVQSGEIPDVSRFPVRGVDVSSYEGVIQWDRAKAAGISFAYMKATEGETFVDDAFAANWAGASAAGLPKGAYHFYDFCDTGAGQAANFIKTVPREAGALPMVIDLEQSDDCAKMPPKAAFRKDLAAFVARVEAAYGMRPVLYVNLGIYNEYLSDAAGRYRLWIADPSHASPSLPAGASWTFWQYSWHGRVDGIAPETDLDVFNGDARGLSGLSH